MDRQDKDSIFNELKRLSRHYAPEWSASENGAGTALARLFSELMAENRARLPEMTERHRLMYLNMYGLSRKPAFPARGYITVTPTADNVITLKSGTSHGVRPVCRKYRNKSRVLHKARSYSPRHSTEAV